MKIPQRCFVGRYETPARSPIMDSINKFELLGQVCDVKISTRARSARLTKTTAVVAANMARKF